MHYICCYTEKQKWPLGDTKLFWALYFFPRPCAPGGSAPGSHSLCLAAIFYATQTTQLYQSKRDRQRECSVCLKNKESVVCCWDLVDWDSLLAIWCTSMSFFFFFCFSQFVVSVDSASSSNRHESISIMCKSRGTLVGNGTQLAIVHAPLHLMSGLYT